MKPANLQHTTRIASEASFDDMPLADEQAVEAFGRWLEGELEQLVNRWSAWSTASANRAAAGRGAFLGVIAAAAGWPLDWIARCGACPPHFTP